MLLPVALPGPVALPVALPVTNCAPVIMIMIVHARRDRRRKKQGNSARWVTITVTVAEIESYSPIRPPASRGEDSLAGSRVCHR
jgi:hypothetical protein